MAAVGTLSVAQSYATSEVRGNGPECQAAMAQERLGGDTPCQRSRAVTLRSHPEPEARGDGWEEQPHIQGAVAAWRQEGLEEPSHVEGQESRQ